MKAPKNQNHATGRREFISKVSAAAGLGLLSTAGINAGTDRAGSTVLPGPELPMISLGPHRISRLICGSNQFLGYSYMGHHCDNHMKEYFTPERAAELLLNCEKAGIRTHQFSSRLDYFPPLLAQGSKLNFISLQSGPEKIAETLEVVRPIAMVHHGGVTDTLFEQGKSGKVLDFVKKVKDLGLLAGVSSHNPDVVRQIADKGWDVDFFMTCFYFLTRKADSVSDPVLPVGHYNFYRDDPKVMTQVIRQVKQPCLAFKILGAGRHGSSQESVRQAFKFAFENIKPIDGVIVGMFPWSFDEISANTGYARELGAS